MYPSINIKYPSIKKSIHQSKRKVLLLTRHALIYGDLNARNQPNAFQMGGDLNARNPT